MDDRTLEEIMDRLDRLEREKAGVRIGLVTDDSPLAVALGGSDIAYTDVKTVGTWTPMVGQQVAVLRWGQDLLVLPGEIT